MSVPAQQTTDEIQIVRTPPTMAEAQLLVQMATNDTLSGAYRGYAVLQEFESPPTLGQLRKKHPRDSEEYSQVMAYLGSCEMTATFVKQGLLSFELVDDLYWISGAWQVCEKVCKGMRREAGEPRTFQNFEVLAARAT
ncbi:MAG TPA: hypothetical protein VFJ17_07420 [Mycobacteriales bacterium]|nr:hypothetical protein [Mycobacteriales bacterium]